MFLSHFLFFTKQSGGNYDALQFCITYLPICLASSSPSSVVLGFCPFHLVFRVLNFCRVTWSKVQRQFGFFVVSRAFHYALRVKISRCINVQKSFSLSAINWILGAAPRKSIDFISGSWCRLSMCAVHDNKQHWCRRPIMCELTCCNNTSPTKACLFELRRWRKYN